MSEIRIPHRGEWHIIAAKTANRILFGAMAEAKVAADLPLHTPQSLEAPANGDPVSTFAVAGALAADTLVDRGPAFDYPIIQV